MLSLCVFAVFMISPYIFLIHFLFFFFSSRRRHTRSYGDWSSDVCSSDLDLSISFAGIKSPNPFWLASAPPTNTGEQIMRSEERRVGKECRSRWWRYH